MIKTVSWPADVERDPTGEFRVIPLLLTECSARGDTREEALQKAVSRLEEKLSSHPLCDSRTLAMLDATSGRVRLFVSFEDGAKSAG